MDIDCTAPRGQKEVLGVIIAEVVPDCREATFVFPSAKGLGGGLSAALLVRCRATPDSRIRGKGAFPRR